jgi:Zn-finger nucleic acid-binding protein/DNA-directed RNA polymerase subunit RPC12/RpoP
MNCKNCGAPIQLNHKTGHYSCTYCQSHQFLNDHAKSRDEVRVSDQPTACYCPSCLDETELVLGLVEQVRINFCPRCCGFLLDADALGYVLRMRRRNYSGADDEPFPVNPDDLKKRRSCPNCSANMEVHPYYGPGNSVIDSCMKCKKVWLDHSELSHLVRAPGLR